MFLFKIWDICYNLGMEKIYLTEPVIQKEENPLVDDTLFPLESSLSFPELPLYDLKSARKKAGLTQQDLSLRTGIHQGDISKIEKGLRNPSLALLERLADGLGMDLVISFQERNSKL